MQNVVSCGSRAALSILCGLTLVAGGCSGESITGIASTSGQNNQGSDTGGTTAGTGGTTGVGSASTSSGSTTAIGGAASATSSGGSGNTTSSGGTAGGTSGGGSGSTAPGGSTSTGGAASGSATGGATGDGTTTLANPGPGSKFFIGTNFWNIDWEPSDNYFQANVDFATTTNPWQPQLLSDLAPYAVIRFMDWNMTNNSNNPQAVWSTRTQKTASQHEPVAFEWQIDLCNRTKKDYWLNVSHEADSSYWTNLANLVESQLDPSLRVYLEWSNEVWNGAFPQRQYAINHAQSLGLSGSDPAQSYYTYEAVRMFEAFENVFGKGNPRLVKVMAGQAAWTGPCEAQRAALADSTINPNGTRPDAYAIAPYLEGTSVQGLQGSMSTVQQWVQSAQSCAASVGVPLISYEGGSDSYAASSCQSVQVDPGMYSVYGSYLSTISGAGMSGPFMQYTHTGGCWGLKVTTSSTLDSSPKYRAVVDWVASH